MSDWFNPPPRPEFYAQELRHELRISTYPVDVPEVCFQLGIVYREDDMGRGYDGALLRTPKRVGILVNSTIPYTGRKLFTGAHELGHYKIKHHARPEYWCSGQDIETYRSSKKVETEANAFASELLLPEAHVKQALRHIPTFEFIQNLAERYGTSLTATALKVVKVSPDPCAVILSADGRIKWAVASRALEQRFTVRSSGRLSPWSCAYQVFDTGRGTGKPVAVPPGAWLEGFAELPDVWEDSILFSDLGVVLTLLTIPDTEDFEFEEIY